MVSDTLKQALANLESALDKLVRDRTNLNEEIRRVETAIAALQGKTLSENLDSLVASGTTLSYVDATVKVLQQTGRSMHLSQLVPRLEEILGADDLDPNSVGSSLNRHIKTVGNRAKITRVAAGTYGLPGWVVQNRTVAGAARPVLTQ